MTRVIIGKTVDYSVWSCFRSDQTRELRKQKIVRFYSVRYECADKFGRTPVFNTMEDRFLSCLIVTIS